MTRGDVRGGVGAVGYSTNLAAALSGVTPAQLREWRRDRGRDGPVLRPRHPTGPAPYSFPDVLALRAFARLGRRIPLRRIHTALAALDATGGTGDPRGWRLVADGDAVLLTPGRPACGRTVITGFAEVVREFTPRAGVVVPHLLRPRPHVTVDPGTRHGRPVIAGTRVPFDAVADLVGDGVPPERIADHYPGVTAAAARDAASFARYADSYRGRRGSRRAG